MKLRWVCTSDYCSIAGQILGGGGRGGERDVTHPDYLPLSWYQILNSC